MVKINNLYAVIVLYNKFCQNSLTYNELNRIKGLNIIVCDNSTKDMGNKDQVINDNNIFINMNGNKGLSKAYNKAIENIPLKDNYICLFDDDTKIEKKYFDILLNEINNNAADVYLPIVKTQNRLLSPCVFVHNRCWEAKNYNEFNKYDISAINSGMTIKGDVFNDFRYNEQIFLDCVDHYFMRYINNLKKKIHIMYDNVLIQSFSMEENTLESTYNRLCIMNNDLKEYYKNNKLMYFYAITAYKCVMIKKFKTLKFLFLKKFNQEN